MIAQFKPVQPSLSSYLFTELYSVIFEDIIQEKRGQWDNWLLIFHKRVSSQSLDAITRIDRLGQLRTAYQKRLYSECYSIWDIWGINDYNMNL